MTVTVHAYDTERPDDTSDLERVLGGVALDRVRHLAVIAKTEGNAAVNDFSRELALRSARDVLQRMGGTEFLDRTTFLFSTGCEGASTPFGYLLADVTPKRSGRARPDAGLAMGCASSRPVKAEEIGTRRHARIVADTVKAAISDAGVSLSRVALAIVKTPVGADRRITSHNSKAVAALGAGVALGEISARAVRDQAIGRNHRLFARRAMVFSGSEIDCVEVLVLANRPGPDGSLAVHSTQMRDILDAAAIKKMLARAGCRLNPLGEVTNPHKVAAMFLKVGISENGMLRGGRTTIRTSHIDPDKHLRAAASGVIGAILGTTRVFISADTVHQAPPGGCVCACIVRR